VLDDALEIFNEQDARSAFSNTVSELRSFDRDLIVHWAAAPLSVEGIAASARVLTVTLLWV